MDGGQVDGEAGDGKGRLLFVGDLLMMVGDG